MHLKVIKKVGGPSVLNMANKSSFALFQYAEEPRIFHINAYEFSESSGFSLKSPFNYSPAVIRPVLPNDDDDLIRIAIDTESRNVIFSRP